MSKTYYVYILVDPRTDTPFYVGKGTGNRAFAHTKQIKAGRSTENPFKDAVIRKILAEGHEPAVVIFDEFQDEDSAYDLEEHIIAELGRRCHDPSGFLTNLRAAQRAPINPPGRPAWNKGMRGYSYHSDEYKDRLRSEREGKTFSDIYGPERAAQILERMSSNLKGRSLDERLGEQRAAIQKAKIQDKLKGRTLEDIVGEEKAMRGRERRRELALEKGSPMQQHSFAPGNTPWNKGRRTSTMTPEEKKERQRESLRRFRERQRQNKHIESPGNIE